MLTLLAATALGFETGANDHLELKWVRDAEEFRALTAATYRAATDQVLGARRRGREPWAVVLDIDETVLDNSVYWLELAAYDRRFDWASWDAWCERRVAEPVAGAAAFVAAVREAGGRVAWVSNRHDRTRAATVDNLRAHGLWSDADRLCLLTDDPAYTKRARRAELRDGAGACGWPGEPVSVAAWFGDTMADLPEDDEPGGPRAEALGRTLFVLPNPMYGSWEHGVTRGDLLPP